MEAVAQMLKFKETGSLLSSCESSFPRKSMLKIALISSSGKWSATAKEYARRTSRCGSKEPTSTYSECKPKNKKEKLSAITHNNLLR